MKCWSSFTDTVGPDKIIKALNGKIFHYGYNRDKLLHVWIYQNLIISCQCQRFFFLNISKVKMPFNISPVSCVTLSNKIIQVQCQRHTSFFPVNHLPFCHWWKATRSLYNASSFSINFAWKHVTQAQSCLLSHWKCNKCLMKTTPYSLVSDNTNHISLLSSE